MTLSETHCDLLIIGAGPAGLMAACWAGKFDMKTRIIDRKSGPTPTGHADGIQSRTLEVMESFGCVESIIQQGVEDIGISYWTSKCENGDIERKDQMDSQPEDRSRYRQTYLNQGLVEQALLDHLNSTKAVQVEWKAEAKSIETFSEIDSSVMDFPVTVEIGDPALEGARERVHARYLVACDGSHSWTADKLKVPTGAESQHTVWGVIDIIPETDFPDIRRSCLIKSKDHGSIMTVPRENGLVRFYVKPEGVLDLKDTRATSLPMTEYLIELASMILQPYHVRNKHCDWWSLYSVKQRLVKQYRPHSRVFLAGDAAHTHSPLAGQGLNISVQDAYNLVWKIGSVLSDGADPMILETYETERRPLAENLMKMDRRLNQVYVDEAEDFSEMRNVRDHYSGAISGLQIAYSPSLLICEKGGNSIAAKSVTLGARLPPSFVVSQRDGSSIPFEKLLHSDGAWKLLVFLGEKQNQAMDDQKGLFPVFQRESHLSHVAKTPQKRFPRIETILIRPRPQPNTSGSLNCSDSQPYAHNPISTAPDTQDQLSATAVFHATKAHQPYRDYGIDETAGCIILCRPDQHVAWIGDMGEWEILDNFFSLWVVGGEAKAKS